MPTGDPSPFESLVSYINRDLRFGYHHLAPFTEKSISDFFDHEVSLYSRRFEASDTNGVLTLTIDLPGFKPADLDVKLERGILRVKAKNARDEFEQSINVGQEVDPDQVEATIEHGVLTIKLPKLASTKARSIKVK